MEDANLYTTSSADYSNVDAAANLAVLLIVALFVTVLLIVMIVAYWRIFKKAGQAGWKSLIPVYNWVILMRIIQRPAWWVLLFFVPFVGTIVSIVAYYDLGKAFGKSTLFNVVGMVLFSGIGLLMLAFGKAQYQLGGASAGQAAMPTSAPVPPAAPQPPVAPANPV